MNIGIIVYSQSGHTLQVCEQLKERLIGEGHSATIDQVTVAGGRTPKTKEFSLASKPSADPYDAVVFASYVEAFSLCQPMSRYMNGLDSLEGKQVTCLITQQFPYPWMGGNRAMSQMQKLCTSKGAVVRAGAVVNWAASRRDKTMTAAVKRLSGAF